MCVCVCVRACVRACVSECVRACVRMCVGPVGVGESVMTVKSLGTGHGGRTRRRRRCVERN